MQVIGLCSGIGGFELAAEWMGWDVVMTCEIDKFCQKVLSYHFRNAYLHDDVKTITNETLKKTRWNPNAATLVCGGFPCQPYSQAGKRLGKDDDRHLWPYFVEAVRIIRPGWCVFENVRGLTNWNGGMVFNEVQADMEAIGYEILPFLLPACAVNAPHRRDRIWFIAYNHSYDGRSKERQLVGKQMQRQSVQEISGIVSEGIVTNANSNVHTGKLDNGGNRSQAQRSEGKDEQSYRWDENREWIWTESGTSSQDSTYTTNKGLEKPEQDKQQKPLFDVERNDLQIDANTSGARCEECDTPDLAARPGYSSGLSAPDYDVANGKKCDKQRNRLCEECEELPIGGCSEQGNGFENFPTQPAVCRGDDGLSSRLAGITFSKHRNESIKGYGNAVVPELVLQLFKAIEAYDNAPR